MEIYLMRHGIADDLKPGLRDSERKLTAEGREKVRAVAKAAVRAGVKIPLILTSPYVRARQTSEIVAEEFDCNTIVTEDCLVPHGSVEDAWQAIRAHRSEPAILLAGHEPLTGQLAAFLLNARGLVIDVKKASLIRIDLESVGAVPRGILKWILVPKLAET